MPVSTTATIVVAGVVSRVSTVMRPPGSVKRIALRMRFQMI
jgi:hypothetical protein